MIIPKNLNFKIVMPHGQCSVLVNMTLLVFYMNFNGCKDWLGYSLVGKSRRSILSCHVLIYLV